MGATTIRAKLNYNTPITAKELNIVFNGVAYENVPRIEDADKGEIYYGSAKFIEYPFELLVESNLDGIWLYTNASGEYTISASIPSSTEITTTPCFDKARGYECKEETTLLTDESVTTTVNEGDLVAHGVFAYSERISADTIKVTFNGVEYTCNNSSSSDEGMYGASTPDLSDCPFMIESFVGRNGTENWLYTQSEGVYSIKIEMNEETIETSECFAKAVNKVVEIHEPTASLSKATFAFVEYAHEELPDAPSVYLAGTLLLAPTLAEMLENIDTTEYYATYESLRMPLTYITSSKAQFTVFEQVTVQSKSYIRHHIITYNSNGSARWDRYDIAIPTAY